jgi:plastocyanin
MFPALVVSGVAVLALSACGSSSSTSSSSAASTAASSAASTASQASTAGTSPTSPTAATTPAPAPAELQVIAGPGIKFDLPEYATTAGVVHVVYVNRDSQRHTLAIVGSDGKTVAKELEVVKSGSKAEGDYTLAAGTYKLICTVPGHNAMKATLTVS